jgi:hypothetical protein
VAFHEGARNVIPTLAPKPHDVLGWNEDPSVARLVATYATGAAVKRDGLGALDVDANLDHGVFPQDGLFVSFVLTCDARVGGITGLVPWVLGYLFSIATRE